MTLTRDPLSELFDRGARALLDRAYARPGQWVTTRLADPTPGQMTTHHISPGEPDPVPGRAARTRWGRAFVRALYYQHRWWSQGGGPGWRDSKRTHARQSGALRVDVGGYRPALGVIPRGLAVSVKLDRGGHAKHAAVARLPHSQRWNINGHPGPATADTSDRDWGEAGPGH